ncbi:MAG TPA: YkoF family thiamine/hydroxymethylpyrimidine-binding protein [Steroidobacteraceae bacterium]|nr:YkoF family thiamine/hydroxymethylpyrimidine-binding protein [Steroidobacteraceae bacterium]
MQYSGLSRQEPLVMDIGVEISLYPLKTDYIPAVHQFLADLNAHQGLKVVTNSMSTQVFGAFEAVMAALRTALAAGFEPLAARSERAVFVMKIIGPLPGA